MASYHNPQQPYAHAAPYQGVYPTTSAQQRSSNTNEWNGGLFSCFDDFESCIKIFLCAPLFLSLEKSEWDGTNCFLNFCCVGPITLRHQVRTVHGIEGNCVADVLAVMFCTPCAMTQVMRTMKSHGPITRVRMA